MRAAFFCFQTEETEAAIQCPASVLKIVLNYGQVIFLTTTTWRPFAPPRPTNWRAG
jgi:hypothetical protein